MVINRSNKPTNNMYTMSKFFYGAMLVIMAIVTVFLLIDGFGEGIEWVLAFFAVITGGSYCYERFVKKGTF